MPTVCLDFDGVLHSYTSGWTGEVPTDPVVMGAVEFVRWLKQKGFIVVVQSTRAAQSNSAAWAIVHWLEAQGFPKLQVVSEKPKAVLYIDDRGFRFRGDFEELKTFIENGYEPWNQKEKP